jgi:hypothetical protein
MTRDEVLAELKARRAEFDVRVDAIPQEALDSPAFGASHSPKQIVAHVSAYEQLIVERLRAARLGEMTEFDPDRAGREAFNQRIWVESSDMELGVALSNSSRGFLSLLEEIASLPDVEMANLGSVSAAVDPAWLEGRPMWEAIASDSFEHYPMHFAQLEAAASA